MSNDAARALALIIGLVAALIVAALLLAPDQGPARHRGLGQALLDAATKVAGEHVQHPAARGHRARARDDRRRGGSCRTAT